MKNFQDWDQNSKWWLKSSLTGKNKSLFHDCLKLALSQKHSKVKIGYKFFSSQSKTSGMDNMKNDTRR